MKRHRQMGRLYDCAACGEPSALVETIGAATVCAACGARIRARARHNRARERGVSADMRDAFRNTGRRKWTPTLA